ncbi:unnamed protein product [Angiostrongylus costaricensis]|uniref:PEST proteolytic signal-containing nuclear protein n=1 Tax=Angiostrongylus costaricensis TaxID=334426 RepID=A0A0R3PNQ9_ANGCS|nr:unnamed protein product [Angiostrongylus costaricensis]
MLRSVSSIEIKADDIDQMKKDLLELYYKTGATKRTVESDPGSEVEARQPLSPGSVTSLMDIGRKQKKKQKNRCDWPTVDKHTKGGKLEISAN